MNEQTYVGGELELFAQARNWKNYWKSKLRGEIRGAVLEVGAGIGSNTLLLRSGAEHRWVCLEPDSVLADGIKNRIASSPVCQNCEVRTGTIASLPATEPFDTILYIDVLEHIQDDRTEVERAADHLTRHGRLIVLSPAHPWLFSPFDKAIGHYRRYTIGMLATLTPAVLRLRRSFYLDSVGLLASAANRLMLRQTMPNAQQLALWDKIMIPCSRIIDPLTGYRLGKSVVCIWERKD